ncbi:YlmH/Sll1252 family protein [Pseudoflavonifractor sp. An187]|uniref:YlmH family RNA-binding protein n=1 Tax=Pseudoflavonifractor sp. An187 TaxID=1965578 RepID=UPI000B379335|nr:YlmH/Sll1252 family protein [Pseudoflavonifractor sp. An187]OUP44809.1 RNA-binding protein [Pseudoflavonifractor sp. An187]
MNKTELLNKFAKDGEQRTQLARVLDQMQRADTRSIPCATQFLSPALRASVELLLDACGHPKHRFCGGYEDAERTVCVFLPHWQEAEDYVAEEELAAVSAAFPRQADLTHRDILGGLMGIGITREKLGDILMGDHEAQIVCLREALPIVLSQFSQAGRYPLKLQEIPLSQLSPAPQTVKEIHDTVATLRLDAVVASGFSLSRSKASQLITTGRVSVNHLECLKTDRLVEEGDVLTCRGLGKCVLAQVGGQSRKGRIILTLHRYV